MDADLIHKALANPLRREILAWLKAPEGFTQTHAAFDGGVPLSAIQVRSGLSQSTVSAHVASMIEAGLLVSKRVGSFLLLSRNEEVIAAFVREVVHGL
ncbi:MULTISPECIES: ArsR/SmtB family transcription factor [Caballeronia]|uniref:Helix-turn-helix domain-containing protein n=1 Tax=Caballeronia jiangsuensis TaxID=1458357 RepID=A0ABW9CG29_9BURK|nr:helix-turn-helix domain-containing protein [Caballeronia sp. GaOx3]